MNVLVFFAHPDDETMLCGGTLALLSSLGARVHYLATTRGEGGEAGEPPICTREELGKVRAAELACAVEALGGCDLQFLDYIDPTVGPENVLYSFTTDLERLAGEVVDAIHRTKADALITHGAKGEYGHPAHRTTHQAVKMAVARLGDQSPLFYTCQAAFEGHPKPRLMNPDDPADLVLDLQPVLDRKLAAMYCHRTQHALFVRNSSRDAGRLLTLPEVLVSMESLHRVFPNGQRPLQDLLANLLRSSGAARDVTG
jgi:LmbE family N-acetylglucosaminyl deacetylase